MTEAPPAIDPDDTGFSTAELEHLLAPTPGPFPALLGVAADATLAGRASLLDRGLAHIADNGSFNLDGFARQTSRILASADRWTTFETGPVNAPPAALLVESGSGTLLGHPSPLGIWTFILIDPDAAVDRLVSQTAMSYADDADVVVTAATHAIARTFSVSRRGVDWHFASGAAGSPTPELTRDNATSDEAAEHLSEFIGSWPNPLEN